MVARGSGLFSEEIRDDTLSAYIRRIVRIPLLPKEEELALGTQIQQGDERAFRKLVEANLRFVVKVATRYQGCGLSLLEAARRYRPEYGVKFITYAVWWIRQAIMQALAVGGGAVRLPIRKARLVSRIREVREELTQAQQEEPSNASVEEALNLDSGEMGALLRGPGAQASLNEEEDGGDPLGLELSQTSAIPPADEDLIRHAFREEVDRMLHLLKPREREVVELRFGLGPEEPQTLEAVGRRLKLSRERVRQIEERAKQKLKLTARTRNLKEFLN